MTERREALVTEKSGYAKDMLDTDLDPGAALGIDTLKGAEMSTAMNQICSIPTTIDAQGLKTLQAIVYDQSHLIAAAMP